MGIRSILSTFALLSSTLSACIGFCADRDDHFEHYSSIELRNSGVIEFWTKRWDPRNPRHADALAAIQAQMVSTLNELPRNWLFKGRLPQRLGILYDATWTKSSGFWSASLQDPDGNPAILLNSRALVDSTNANALLVHEITHLVHHRFRPHEASWIREGVALLAEYVYTGYFNPVLEEAFLNPESSLTADLNPLSPEYSLSGESSNQYGHILQFFYYLYRLCGRDTFLDAALTSGLDTALERADCGTFDTQFIAFETARFVNDHARREGYVMSTALRTTVRPSRREIPPYSATAYELKDGAACHSGDRPWGSTRCIRIRMN